MALGGGDHRQEVGPHACSSKSLALLGQGYPPSSMYGPGPRATSAHTLHQPPPLPRPQTTLPAISSHIALFGGANQTMGRGEGVGNNLFLIKARATSSSYRRGDVVGEDNAVGIVDCFHSGAAGDIIARYARARSVSRGRALDY